MSFKELRGLFVLVLKKNYTNQKSKHTHTHTAFTEIMRSIGYPQMISMEGFRTPNFNQVFSILKWLLERYDHSAEIPTTVETEEERIQMLKVAAQITLGKARIKLNTRKLYSADVYAVQELLKLAQLLYDATRQADPIFSTTTTTTTAAAPPISSGWNPANDVKSAKQLATEMTTSGATIHGLVEGEITTQEMRTRAMRDFDNEQLEKAVHVKIRAVTEDTTHMAEQLENMKQDEASLKQKIEKKKVEMERMKTRLAGLRGLRPAFMDEYERLERELQQLYSSYLEHFRNLDYLESELDALSRKDDSKEKRTKRVLSVYSVAAKGAERIEMKHAVDVVVVDEGEIEKSVRFRGREQTSTTSDDDDDDEIEEEGEEEEEEKKSDAQMSPATTTTTTTHGKRRLTPGPAKRVHDDKQREEAEHDDGDDDDDEQEEPKPLKPMAKQQQQQPKKMKGTLEPGESDDSVSPVVSDDEADPEDK